MQEPAASASTATISVLAAMQAAGQARLLNFCIVSIIFCGSAAAPTAFMALVAVAMLWPTVDVAAVVCARIHSFTPRISSCLVASRCIQVGVTPKQASLDFKRTACTSL